MRDENKRTYYVGKPQKSLDGYNATSIVGYSELTEYQDVVNENAESSENDKFGTRDIERVRIVHDDNDGDTPNVEVNDAVWLEQPAVDASGYYRKPPFIVESVQTFGRHHAFTLKRTVNAR